MIVLILIYLASVIGAYLTFRRLYSAGGEWEGLSASISDIFFMFLPLANTVIMLGGGVTIAVAAIQDFILSLNIKINYNRFFGIKKKKS